MRPRIDNYDDFDEVEDFAFERSQALQKLLDEYRREERSSHHFEKLRGRRHSDSSDWEEEDWY